MGWGRVGWLSAQEGKGGPGASHLAGPPPYNYPSPDPTQPRTLAYLNRHGYIQVTDIDGLGEVIGYTLAVFGFYTQWQWGFSLPFPLNLIMLPFTFIEWYIRWTITG